MVKGGRTGVGKIPMYCERSPYECRGKYGQLCGTLAEGNESPMILIIVVVVVVVVEYYLF